MKLFGIAGHSDISKTTLREQLVPELVSLINHCHKDIEVAPGKDLYRLR